MSEETNILTEEKPKSIKLADGKEYTLPPIDLTTLANIEKTFGFPLRNLGEKTETEPMQTLQLLTYALLKENYPELTKEQAGRLVTLKEFANLTKTFAEIMAIAG